GVERREAHEDVGDRSIRDEGLRAIDEVGVAIAAGDGLESARVAARTGLRKAVRADLPRGEQIGKVTRAQRIGSADVDGGPAETGGTADDVPERSVRARELLDGDAIAELSETLAADLLTETKPEEAHACHRRGRSRTRRSTTSGEYHRHGL